MERSGAEEDQEAAAEWIKDTSTHDNHHRSNMQPDAAGTREHRIHVVRAREVCTEQHGRQRGESANKQRIRHATGSEPEDGTGLEPWRAISLNSLNRRLRMEARMEAANGGCECRLRVPLSGKCPRLGAVI